MAVRLKTRWHHTKRKGNRRGGRPKTLADRANVLAHNLWKIAFAIYTHMADEDFRFTGGEQITAVLTEILAFLIQVTDRNVYGQFEETDRKELITELAKRLAITVDDNLTELLGPGEYANAFINVLNERFKGYAQCSYGASGPGYAFLRYFGDNVSRVMSSANNKWVIEHVMEIEAPEALKRARKVVGEVLGVNAR